MSNQRATPAIVACALGAVVAGLGGIAATQSGHPIVLAVLLPLVIVLLAVIGALIGAMGRKGRD